jgi:adenine phosphoribosyltransferase
MTYPGLLQDEFEMQVDAIAPGQSVVIIDDVIATGAYFFFSATRRVLPRETDSESSSCLCMFRVFVGGSAAAAGELVEKQGGKLLQCLFIAEVTQLNGRSKLKVPVYSIIQSDG